MGLELAIGIGFGFFFLEPRVQPGEFLVKVLRYKALPNLDLGIWVWAR